MTNRKLDAIGQELPENPPADKSAEEALFQMSYDDPKLKEFLGERTKQAEALFQKIGYYQSLYRLRFWVAVFIFLLIAAWLVGVIYLVFLGSYDVHYFSGACTTADGHSWYAKLKFLPEGCKEIGHGTYLNLSETIVVTLITTTTVNVLGLSFIVARWLFPNNATGNTADANEKSA